MPLKTPQIKYKYKLQLHHYGASILITLRNDLPIYCIGEIKINFVFTVYFQNHN